MEKITWPDICKCGEVAHHHLYTDDEKHKYEHLCDGCFGAHLAKKSLDSLREQDKASTS